MSTKKANPLPSIPRYIPKALFPSRLTPKKKEACKDEDLLETFTKVQINIPLPSAIQQIPRCKSFKEPWTRKRNVKEKKSVMVSWNVSKLSHYKNFGL